MTDRTDRNGPGGPQPEVREKTNFALLAFLVAVALVVVFFLVNGQEVEIDFLVKDATTTVHWSILVAALLGIVIDRGFGIWWRRRRRRRNSGSNN